MDWMRRSAAEPSEQNIEMTGAHDHQHFGASSFIAKIVSSQKVESRGIVPVPIEERTSRRTHTIVRETISILPRIPADNQ